MRSSPYSQASYQPSPYSSPYSVPGYGTSQSSQVPINPTHYSDPNDQTKRHTQSRMHNGSSSTSMSSFFPSGVTSAYTQILQSTAFSQASTTTSKKSSPGPTTANNNNPYISHATTTTASSNLPLHSQPNTRSSSHHSYDDQVAAALLDRFGGQFNSQFMSEMAKTAKAIPATSIYPEAPNPTKASLGDKEFNIYKKTQTVVAQTSRSSSPQQKHQDLKVSNPEISDFKSEVMQHGNDVENYQNPNVINSNTAVHNSSRPGPHPSNSIPMSITNKIKDLERKLASTSTSRHNSASSLSNDDRSELKGLWKMQANLFKQKLQSTSASQNSSHTSSTLVNSISSSDPKNVTSSASAPLTVSSNTASPRKSVSRPDKIPKLSLVPPLIHTPRSPPHPPPPLLSYNHSQTKPYANKPLSYTPPSQPSSSHTPQYLPRIQGPPSPSTDEPPVPSSDHVKNNKTISESTQLSIQNDRMEVKNSGIPGPSAISWKRKSAEDSPTGGNLSKKRRPCDGDSRGNLDPYSFDDDSDKGRAAPGQTDINNDFTNGSELFKFKLRDNEAESDDSSLSRSSSPAKMKKRPKMEEWSVNKEKEKSLKSTKKTGRQCNKNESVSNENSKKKCSLWRLSSNNKALGEGNNVSKTTTTKDSEQSSTKSSVTNAKVWLKAFGASDLEKKESFKNSTDSEKNIPKILKEPGTSSLTILEIPPEVRRKPRPKFGGLIHFDPDWNHGVRRHHERCRVPSTIENSDSLKPKILAGVQTPKKSYEDHARKAMVSPPNMILLEKERLEKAALNVAPKLPPSFSNDDELSGELPSIVETILENRKKLREATGSRIYKVPFMKEKKKRIMRAPVHTEIKSGPIGLLPTPGLPPFTTDTKEVLLGTDLGNFRHYTFENFIQKGKSTELLSSKKRHNHSSKSVLTFREIFGLEIKKEKITEGKKILDEKSVKDRSTVDKGKKVSSNDRLIKKESLEEVKQKLETTFKKDKPELTANFEAHLKTSSKKDKKSSATREPIKSAASPKTGRKKESNFSPKFRASTFDDNQPLIIEDEFGYSHEVGDPSDREKNLQFDLGAFALDLLEDNPSWSKQVAIQNLVIWEPTEPEIPEPSSKKKKGKKKKARKSGMDFHSSKKKSKNIITSRAGSLSADGDVCQVVYSLDKVIAESSRWVIDKNAGETILHRASKMGYPDVAAYALDMADTTAGERDYAGLTPLHKAALKGNFNVARILLSYGSDPGAGVKGTRALHEGNFFTLWSRIKIGVESNFWLRQELKESQPASVHLMKVCQRKAQRIEELIMYQFYSCPASVHHSIHPSGDKIFLCFFRLVSGPNSSNEFNDQDSCQDDPLLSLTPTPDFVDRGHREGENYHFESPVFSKSCLYH